MKPTDKAAFAETLNLCYATQLKPVPAAAALNLWFTLLAPYSLEQVSDALAKHMAESSFAPVPADVIKRLPRESDGRPDANEAWAIALRSRDERDTVVWTQECAQAFAIASAVLDGGDEVGARMAFKAAYERLIEAARARGAKAEWVKSLGHDPYLREQVLTDAVRAGRLLLDDVKTVVPALAAPTENMDPHKAAVNLARLRQIVEAMPSTREKLARAKSAELELERERLDAAKREAARRVAEYEGATA